MTVTLDLKADEARVLQEIARSAETTIEAVLHALIAQVSASYSLPPRRAEAESAAESAEAESAEAESAEAESAEAERRREQEEVEANIRRWHAERAAL